MVCRQQLKRYLHYKFKAHKMLLSFYAFPLLNKTKFKNNECGTLHLSRRYNDFN